MAETGTRKKVVVVKKKSNDRNGKVTLTPSAKKEAAELKAFAQQNGDAIKQAIVESIVNERNAGNVGYVPRNEDAKFGRNLEYRHPLGDSSVSVGNNIWVVDRETGAYNAAKQSEKDLIQNMYNQAAKMRAARRAGQKNISDSVYDALVGRADRLQAIQLMKDYFNPDTNKVLYRDDSGEFLKNPAAFDSIFNLYGSERGENALKGLLAGESADGLGGITAGNLLSKGGELRITPSMLEQFLRSQKLYDVLRRREKEIAAAGGSDNLYRSKLEEMLGYEPGKMNVSRGGDALRYGDIAGLLQGLTKDVAAAREKKAAGGGEGLTEIEKDYALANLESTNNLRNQNKFRNAVIKTFRNKVFNDFGIPEAELKDLLNNDTVEDMNGVHPKIGNYKFASTLPEQAAAYEQKVEDEGVAAANIDFYNSFLKPYLRKLTNTESATKEEQLVQDLKREWSKAVDNQAISQEEANEISGIIQQVEQAFANGETEGELGRLIGEAVDKMQAALDSRERPTEVEDEVKFTQYFEAKYAQVQDQLTVAKEEIEDTIVRLRNALQVDIEQLDKGSTSVAAGVAMDTARAMLDFDDLERAEKKVDQQAAAGKKDIDSQFTDEMADITHNENVAKCLADYEYEKTKEQN